MIYDIVFVITGAILGVFFSVILTRPFESSFNKLFNQKFGKKSIRKLSGIWITQYKYKSGNNNSGQLKIETQCVFFKQRGNFLTGRTVDALKHPEVFEGKITKDRYFTGQYLNIGNHHNYHGAFQFILSNSKGLMEGKWIGFNDNGNKVLEGDWRWEQFSTSKKLDVDVLQSAKLKASSIDLFDDTYFNM